jgi:hypothetical protein
VEYGEWAALAELGLQHPGERGQHLEGVLRELVAEADRNPSSSAPQHIHAVLEAIPRDPALTEARPLRRAACMCAMHVHCAHAQPATLVCSPAAHRLPL